MTYCELIRMNGASVTTKALEQRARRMAQRKSTYLSKFRSPPITGYGVCEYWCDSRLFQTIEEVIDHLAERG